MERALELSRNLGDNLYQRLEDSWDSEAALWKPVFMALGTQSGRGGSWEEGLWDSLEVITDMLTDAIELVLSNR